MTTTASAPPGRTARPASTPRWKWPANARTAAWCTPGCTCTKWVLHAWGETDEAVYDLTETRNPQPRADYYARNGVTEERLRRYGRVEFFTIMADTGSFGPFDTAFFFAPESDTDPLAR